MLLFNYFYNQNIYLCHIHILHQMETIIHHILEIRTNKIQSVLFHTLTKNAHIHTLVMDTPHTHPNIISLIIQSTHQVTLLMRVNTNPDIRERESLQKSSSEVWDKTKEMKNCSPDRVISFLSTNATKSHSPFLPQNKQFEKKIIPSSFDQNLLKRGHFVSSHLADSNKLVSTVWDLNTEMKLSLSIWDFSSQISINMGFLRVFRIFPMFITRK